MKIHNQKNVNTSYNTNSSLTVQIASIPRNWEVSKCSNIQRYKNNNYNHIKNKNKKDTVIGNFSKNAAGVLLITLDKRVI